jgi:hypothetical protein
LYFIESFGSKAYRWDLRRETFVTFLLTSEKLSEMRIPTPAPAAPPHSWKQSLRENARHTKQGILLTWRASRFLSAAIGALPGIGARFDSRHLRGDEILQHWFSPLQLA